MGTQVDIRGLESRATLTHNSDNPREVLASLHEAGYPGAKLARVGKALGETVVINVAGNAHDAANDLLPDPAITSGVPGTSKAEQYGIPHGLDDLTGSVDEYDYARSSY